MFNDPNDEEDKSVQDTEYPFSQDSENVDLQPEINSEVDSFSPEYKASENMAQNLQPQEANPNLQKYQDYLSQYKQLQDTAGKKETMLNALGGLQTIGASLAGKGYGNIPDTSNLEPIRKSIQSAPQEFEQAQKVQATGLSLDDETQARDPNSQISQTYRKYANEKLKINFDPNTSAYDMMKLLKSAGRPAQNAKGQVVRTFNPVTQQVEMQVFDPTSQSLTPLNATAGFAMQPRQDPRTKELMIVNPATAKIERQLTGPVKAEAGTEDIVQINKSNLTKQQQEDLDKTREAFVADTKDDRSALNAAQGIKMTIASGKEIGGDILREIQNQLARGSGEKGAMTDRDVEPFGGRTSLLARINRSAVMAAKGQLPDEDRQFLMKVAGVMEKRAKAYVDNKSDFFVNNTYNDLKTNPSLKGVNFDKSSVKNLIGIGSAVNPNPSEMVQVVSTKTGKTLMLPKDKVKDALKKKLIQPLAEE